MNQSELRRHLIKHIGIFQNYNTSDLADFAETIMKGCDINKDGKVSKKVILLFTLKTFNLIFLQELTVILIALSNQ